MYTNRLQFIVHSGRSPSTVADGFFVDVAGKAGDSRSVMAVFTMPKSSRDSGQISAHRQPGDTIPPVITAANANAQSLTAVCFVCTIGLLSEIELSLMCNRGVVILDSGGQLVAFVSYCSY